MTTEYKRADFENDLQNLIQQAKEKLEENKKRVSIDKEELTKKEAWALEIEQNILNEKDELAKDWIIEDALVQYKKKFKPKIREDIKEFNKDFILDESILPQQIDHAAGFIRIKKKILRYYGSYIYAESRKATKKGDTMSRNKIACIILEDGKILSRTNMMKDSPFEFVSTMNTTDRRWSLDSIKKFIEGDYQDVSFQKVHELFRKTYVRHLTFEEEEWYDFNALWDQATYFQDIFDKSLIHKMEGPSGAAKSKTMKNSSNLAFNARKFLCPNPANFFRYRHNNKAMICIEEAERLFDDSKTKQKGDDELVEYLNASYERGSFVPRQNQNDMNLTDEFDPYGWTKIGSINPIRGALHKRSIVQFMIKARKDDPRGSTEVPSPNNHEYVRAREYAYVNGLVNYSQLAKALIEIKNNYGIANREWQISKPLIALARCISEKLEQRIGQFLARKFYVREEGPDESSWEFKLVCCLIKLTVHAEEFIFVSNTALREAFIRELDDEYTKISMHRIAKMMSSLGLKEYSCHNSSGTERGYELHFLKLADIIIRNDNMAFEKLLEKVSEVSKCQKKLNKIKKWHSDTFESSDSFSDTYTSSAEGSDTLTDTTLFSGPTEEKIVDEVSYKRTHRKQIRQIIWDFGEKFGPLVEIDNVIAKAGTQGIDESDAQMIIEKLKRAGDIYEPKRGFLSRI